jgi:hypothetical protein
MLSVEAPRMCGGLTAGSRITILQNVFSPSLTTETSKLERLHLRVRLEPTFVEPLHMDKLLPCPETLDNPEITHSRQTVQLI